MFHALQLDVNEIELETELLTQLMKGVWQNRNIQCLKKLRQAETKSPDKYIYTSTLKNNVIF